MSLTDVIVKESEVWNWERSRPDSDERTPKEKSETHVFKAGKDFDSEEDSEGADDSDSDFDGDSDSSNFPDSEDNQGSKESPIFEARASEGESSGV